MIFRVWAGSKIHESSEMLEERACKLKVQR